MTTALVARLLQLQEADGCFPSTVAGPDWSGSDRNGFTTALVLRKCTDSSPSGTCLSLHL